MAWPEAIVLIAVALICMVGIYALTRLGVAAESAKERVDGVATEAYGFGYQDGRADGGVGPGIAGPSFKPQTRSREAVRRATD